MIILNLVSLIFKGMEVKAQSFPEFTQCFGASEFILVDEEIEFDDAVARCQDRGGQLAVPFTETEYQVFVSMVLGSTIPIPAGIMLGNTTIHRTVWRQIKCFTLTGLRDIGE